MSSFLVLRASSSRRTLAALPSLDHASNPGRPLRRTRTVNQSALLVREALVSRRQFSSSLPTREDSMYDKRMKEYQDSARYTTAEKKRRQELVAIRAGQAYPLLNPLTYPPPEWGWHLANPWLWSNINRHRKHRKNRDNFSRESATVVEGKGLIEPSGWMADLPTISPVFASDQGWADWYNALPDYFKGGSPVDKVRFVLKWTIYLGVQPAKGILNIRHPIKLWTRMKEDYLRAAMNKGVKDEDKMTSRPATRPDQRYPDLMESMFKMWQRFNVAQARRRITTVNSTSMHTAHRNAHILMSSNRVVEWEMLKAYAPPRFLWMRFAPLEREGVRGRGFVQMCLQFDTEQRITLVEPEVRKEEPRSYPRRPDEGDEPWRIGQYRQDLTRERYHRAIAKWQQVRSEILLPEDKKILSLEAVEGRPRHTTTSRVIDNVVFQFDTDSDKLVNGKPNWKVFDRVHITPPHYTMSPEEWEEIQRKIVKEEEKMGNFGAQQVHHIAQNKWKEIEKRKEKAGEITVEEDKDEDPVKTRMEQARKRVEAWKRVDEQEKRERALLAMNPGREDIKRRQAIARNEVQDLFTVFEKVDNAERAKTAAEREEKRIEVEMEENKGFWEKHIQPWVPSFLSRNRVAT